MILPYFTTDFPGIGGQIKQRAEDFFVQEIPLYEASGSGEHVYTEIQKIGLTTFEAVHRIARTLNVHEKDIGYAGQKDAKAVTRQVFSILGATTEAVNEMRIPGMTVQWAARHGNKLRLGHLSGNRFAIKIREVDPLSVVKLRPVLSILEKRGVPNYFGEQRFGRRQDNDQLGAALVRGDNIALLKRLLGSPDPSVDDPQSLRARAAFDARDNETAMSLFPRHCGMERRILARLIKTRKPNAAVRAIDEKLRRLWVSALQSKMFNDTLARRIESFDRVMDGDLAYKHENGACFLVESAQAEQARAEVFEISATGPLVGYRMSLPQGEPWRIEQEVMAAAQLTPESFKGRGEVRAKGARRPLRVKPIETTLESGVDDHGSYITVAFTLPAGSYATVLLRELMKNHATEDSLTPASTPGGDEIADAQDDEDPAEDGHQADA